MMSQQAEEQADDKSVGDCNHPKPVTKSLLILIIIAELGLHLRVHNWAESHQAVIEELVCRISSDCALRLN